MAAPKSSASSLRALWVSGSLLLAVIIIIGTASCYRYFTGYSFTWPHFALLCITVEAFNIPFLILAWRKRKLLGLRAQTAILDWAGLSIWFWTLGPLYQSLTLILDSRQLQLDAFIYFWEVPIIGGIAILLGQLYFKPVAAYIDDKRSNDPAVLMKLLERIPRNVAIRALVLTSIGYGLGGVQLFVFGHAPAVEAWKNFGNGIVLSMLLSLFYGLLFDQYLANLKSKLRQQYGLPLRIRKFSEQITLATSMVILSSLCTLVLLYVQSFQLIIRDHVRVLGENEIATLIADTQRYENGLPAQGRVDDLAIGQDGRSWLLPAIAPAPVSDISKESYAAYLSQSSGTILDLQNDAKLIIFDTVGSSKVGTVIYMTTFNESLASHVSLVLIVTAVIALIAFITLFVFIRIMSHSIAALTVAVERAKRTGTYSSPDITTSDEFEVLSDAFATFIGQSHERTQLLHEERARLESSIEALGQGFVITDAHGGIIARNTAVGTVLGPKADHAATIAELCEGLDADDMHKVSGGVSDMLSGKQVQHEWRVTTARHKIVRIFISPIINEGDTLGVVILLQDITEDMVVARSRDEFFSIASHELRTPLTAIRGNTSMIKHYYSEEIRNPDLSHMVDDIHESSVRLIQIVNDFLDLSRIEQRRMQYHPTDFKMSELILEVMHDLRTVAKKKHIYIRLEAEAGKVSPMARADRDRTKQVLYNLVGNAVKFTDSGGVTIEVKPASRALRVFVRDTGSGIEADDQKYLFRKFQQANHSLITRNSAGGTGLGLYISKMLIEEMGGKLQLDHSSPGKGAQFSFTVPLTPAKAAKTSR